jgi:hypothetical protein
MHLPQLATAQLVVGPVIEGVGALRKTHFKRSTILKVIRNDLFRRMLLNESTQSPQALLQLGCVAQEHRRIIGGRNVTLLNRTLVQTKP